MTILFPPDLIPSFDELFDDTYSPEDRLQMMPISTSANGNGEIEKLLLRVFAHAVITKSSDVNVSLKGSEDNLTVVININRSGHFTNLRYCGGGDPLHFKTKFFNLMNAAQGGATGVTVRGRFAIRFPLEWARQKGLMPHEDEPYYYVNFRVIYSKTFDGCSFVCRVLDDQNSPGLHQLGMSGSSYATIKKIIQRSSGLVLCVGPTGCGKTTLLNAMVKTLNDGQKAISTVEDPVEYRIRGDGQIIQLEVDGEMTFQRALEAFMRQHPDVIVVGEILNSEVARLATQAAQTGHIVFATLHAEDACSAPERFVSMFAEDERDWAASTLAANLKLILAPRLLHKSQAQTQLRSLRNHERAWFKENGLVVPERFMETTAPHHQGKFGVLEAVEVDYELMKLINERATYDDIFQSVSKQLQFETLAMCGGRAIEDGKCKLSDCRFELPISLTASAHYPLRSVLAQKYNLSYSEINRIIDQHVLDLHNDLEELEELNMEEIIVAHLNTSKVAA